MTVTQRELDEMQVEAEEYAREIAEEFSKAFMGNRLEVSKEVANGAEQLHSQVGR